MSDVAAPPALALRRRSTLAPLRLDASLEIGAGGEARIFSVPGDGKLVAKVYHRPTVERARKVALMLEEPPRIADPRAVLAWPVDLLLGEGGTFAGFLMPRAEGPRLFELYNPITRRQSGALCDPAILHRAGIHLAAAFDAVHARGYVVGDVNESNVLLSPAGGVTLVDTDSFQVRDPEDGTVHRSKVGKPEFTPPELQGKTFADFDRTPEHDRFGLAVLLFLALMEGTHPFAGRMETRAETPPVEERIRRGLFAHHGHPEIHPPKLAPPFTVLDPELRALFVRCFAEGHRNPSARPTAAEWRAALAAAEARLGTCAANPRHRFGPHLDACPWCERTALLHGRDPFPATPSPARRRPAPPRRIAAPPPAPVAAAASPAQPPAPAVAPAQPAGRHKFSWEMDKKELGLVIVAMLPIAALAIFLLLAIGFSPPGLGLLLFVGGVSLLQKWNATPNAVPPAPRPAALPPTPRPAVSTPPPPPAVPASNPRAAVPAPAPRAAVSTPKPRPSPAAPAPAIPLPALTPIPAAPIRRLRMYPPTVQGVDATPVLLNRAELEDSPAGLQVPAGMDPRDWTMRVVAWVREDGAVEPSSVRVVRPAPRGEAFDAAVRAVSRARLQPLLRRGRPLAGWVSFEVGLQQA